MQASNKMSLTMKVLLAMFAGIIVGLVINIANLNGEGSIINTYIVDGILLTIGKMFVNALKMLVVPLVFFSLICGVCGIGNLSTLGRVGTKSFLLYLMTTAIAIAVAIGLAATVGIGEGMSLQSMTDFAGKEAPPLTQVIINIIPSNPVQAMANGEQPNGQVCLSVSLDDEHISIIRWLNKNEKE